jgi:hypothetical protein
LFSKYSDETKEKAIMELIKDKYAAAGKGDARVKEFLKEVKKILSPKSKKSKK